MKIYLLAIEGMKNNDYEKMRNHLSRKWAEVKNDDDLSFIIMGEWCVRESEREKAKKSW
jgi:hypothetical protein